MSFVNLNSKIILTLISAFCIFSASEYFVNSSENNEPVIGVLAQEPAYFLEKQYPGVYKSYVAASYVKFLEGAGARVIPVMIGRDKAYYEDVINKTNGLLLPGGATWFNQSEGYADAGVTIYNLAIEANNRGDYYPILGICLGMELLLYAAAGGEYRAHCDAWNVALPLEFKSGFRESKLFGHASQEIIDIFRTKPVTANFHRFCITESILKEFNLENEWLVSSVNHDKNNTEFISTIESRKYPFLGVQFHPEKNIYEWKPKKGIIHTSKAIKTSQYIANLFVDIARHSSQKFLNNTQNELIWNYPITYTGNLPGTSYEQCYLFK